MLGLLRWLHRAVHAVAAGGSTTVLLRQVVLVVLALGWADVSASLSSWTHEFISELVVLLATLSHMHRLIHLLLLVPGLVKVDALIKWELAEVEGILIISHINVLLMVLASLIIHSPIHHLSLVLGPHMILSVVGSSHALSQSVLVVLEVLDDDGVPPQILSNRCPLTLIFSLVDFPTDQVAGFFS